MQLHWHTEPTLLISLLTVGWLYALGMGPFRNRIAPGKSFPIGSAISFYLGLLITYLAVGSPLDQLGEQFLFSAHMIQHMLLVYFAPTLFFWGAPRWLLDWLLQPKCLHKPMSILTHPACGGLIFTAIYTIWHIPPLYEAALHDKWIHVIEHWTMFGFAILMLWPFLNKSTLVPRPGYGVRMLTMFLLMVGQLPVFAFLSFAGEAIYPTYIWAPRISIPSLEALVQLDPLNDQILGGIIMKVVNMGFSLTILAVAFYQWSKSEEPDNFEHESSTVSLNKAPSSL